VGVGVDQAGEGAAASEGRGGKLDRLLGVFDRQGAVPEVMEAVREFVGEFGCVVG
jgi:hypothetical protein